MAVACKLRQGGPRSHGFDMPRVWPLLVLMSTSEVGVMGALIALASRVGGQLATRGGRRILGPLVGLGSGVGGFAIGEAAFGGNGDGKRRRRRRKALTSDDVRTALTIASAISKKAAENFILVRTRGQ